MNLESGVPTHPCTDPAGAITVNGRGLACISFILDDIPVTRVIEHFGDVPTPYLNKGESLDKDYNVNFKVHTQVKAPEPPPLSKWTRRFLSLADLVASWSKDESTKVGAVIADSRNRVVSLGFNGFPHGVNDESLPRERKLLRTIHAEENAIMFAQRDLTGCAIYVTHHPCGPCAAKIAQAGITRVVVARHMHDKWAAASAEAALIFQEAGVELEICQ